MKPRNIRVLVFATALLTAPLLPAWSQAPVHPRPPEQEPKKEPEKPPVVIKETPIEQGAPQQPPEGGAAQGPPQDPATAQPPEQGTQATPPGQTAAPGQTAPKVVKPEEIGISFTTPPGW